MLREEKVSPISADDLSPARKSHVAGEENYKLFRKLISFYEETLSRVGAASEKPNFCHVQNGFFAAAGLFFAARNKILKIYSSKVGFPRKLCCLRMGGWLEKGSHEKLPTRVMIIRARWGRSQQRQGWEKPARQCGEIGRRKRAPKRLETWKTFQR